MTPFDRADEFSSGYIAQPGPSSQAKARYWKTAFGLQAVDGLAPSEYVHELAASHTRGDISIAQVTRELNSYYASGSAPQQQSRRTEEADKVSARIVELLGAREFTLDHELLTHIHRHLFQDLAPEIYHPGAYRTESLVKLEPALNGDTLLYGAPGLIERSLEILFAKERDYQYATYSDGGAGMCYADLSHFAGFVSDVWFTHPFWEGNTRTVAVFCELYLNHLGFDLDNEPFEAHASFFRNALVRANYRNRSAGVDVDFGPLVAFISHVLGEDDGPLNEADTYCRALFEQPERVRNVDHAFAAPMQQQLKEAGITEAVLAR